MDYPHCVRGGQNAGSGDFLFDLDDEGGMVQHGFEFDQGETNIFPSPDAEPPFASLPLPRLQVEEKVMLARSSPHSNVFGSRGANKRARAAASIPSLPAAVYLKPEGEGSSGNAIKVDVVLVAEKKQWKHRIERTKVKRSQRVAKQKY